MDTQISVVNDWKFELESAAATQAARDMNEAERKAEEQRQRDEQRLIKQGQNLRSALRYLGIELDTDPIGDRVTIDGYNFTVRDFKAEPFLNGKDVIVRFDVHVGQSDPLLSESETDNHVHLYRLERKAITQNMRVEQKETADWVKPQARLAEAIQQVNAAVAQNQALWERIKAGEFDEISTFGESQNGATDDATTDEPVVDEAAELREKLWQKDSEIYRLRAELEELQTVKALAEALETFMASRNQ